MFQIFPMITRLIVITATAGACTLLAGQAASAAAGFEWDAPAALSTTDGGFEWDSVTRG